MGSRVCVPCEWLCSCVAFDHFLSPQSVTETCRHAHLIHATACAGVLGFARSIPVCDAQQLSEFITILIIAPRAENDLRCTADATHTHGIHPLEREHRALVRKQTCGLSGCLGGVLCGTEYPFTENTFCSRCASVLQGSDYAMCYASGILLCFSVASVQLRILRAGIRWYWLALHCIFSLKGNGCCLLTCGCISFKLE